MIYNSVMSRAIRIAKIKSSIADIAPKYNIQKVILFGSYASGKRTKKSDVDLLVEFGKEPVSLLKVASFKVDIEEMLGKEVDVIPSPISKDSLLIIDNEVLLYEQKRYAGA